MAIDTAQPAPVRTIVLLGVLLFTGVSWGLTISLATIATASGINPLTVALWSALSGSILLCGVLLVRRFRPPLSLAHLVFYAITGFVGTGFPHALSFQVAMHLPAGNRAIVYALIPMITLVISFVLVVERPSLRRFAGIAIGFVAMLIMLLPGAQAPLPGQYFWTFVTLFIAISYAVENIYVGLKRPANLDAICALWGMTTAGALMLLPVVWLLGAPVMLPFDGSLAEGALLLSTVSHLLAYSGLLYMLNHGGVVFASQVSYIVTPAAVVWGIVLLNERLSAAIALSLVLIMAGLALIKPNPGKRG